MRRHQNNVLIFLFLMPLLLMSQEDYIIQKTYFDNGQLQAEGLVVYGKKHGEWRHYFESGAIRIINMYEHGVQQGKAYWFHPNGMIGWEENYAQGAPEGKFLYYDEKGKLRIEKVFEKGKEVSYIFDGKEMKKN